jgi:proton-dependent oligopeptide transporter, POT family
MTPSAATAEATPAAPAAPAAVLENKMPSGIWFIVSNEFAERFCFYGINSILVAFMVGSMKFPDGKALAWGALFKSAAYGFPVLGAVVSDVFWGKFRTIFVFSMFYAAGCICLALFGSSELALVASLGLVALGTGGIKPCVSTNVGDQFTSKNSHLIERAFSLFYMSINAGSSISIFLCPALLDSPNWGPRWAFGMPAIMMVMATIAFIAGRNRYVKVPPAGKAWLKEVFSKDGLKLIGKLGVLYLFVALFWSLWDQSNGGALVLQAKSPLMDKSLFGLFTFKAAQVQVVNGLFILMLAPVFSYVIYPAVNKVWKVTPLRKIGAGLVVMGAAFLVVGWLEDQIMAGKPVTVWWQLLAYLILTAAELLVSVTALEFSYKQAPLRVKSFIMALFLLSTTLGNGIIAAVNFASSKPVHATKVETGAQTWVTLDEAAQFVPGQKIDFNGDVGVKGGDGKDLSGTYLVAEIQGSRLRIMDPERKDVATSGELNLSNKDAVSTYSLVGSAYYYFFIAIIWIAALIFAVYARFYKEQDFVRTEGADAAA